MKIDPAGIAVLYMVLLLFNRAGTIKNFVKRIGENIADQQIQMLANRHVAIRQYNQAVQDAVAVQFQISPSPVII